MAKPIKWSKNITNFRTGMTYSIENIRVEIVKTPETMYNFQVEDFHAYHMESVGVLVHNTNCPKSADGGQEGGADVTPPSTKPSINQGKDPFSHVNFKKGDIKMVNDAANQVGVDEKNLVISFMR